MSYMEEISWISKSGYSDMELLEYIDKHFDEIECELNGEEYKEPKKCDHNFCIDCNVEKTIDYEITKNDLILNSTRLQKTGYSILGYRVVTLRRIFEFFVILVGKQSIR